MTNPTDTDTATDTDNIVSAAHDPAHEPAYDPAHEPRPYLKPTVNLNGTEWTRLAKPLRKVVEQLADVQATMRLCTPHGRDYQCEGGQEQYEADRALWEAQMANLETLKTLCTRSWLHIHDQSTP